MVPGLKVESKEDGETYVLALAGELSLAEAEDLERRLEEAMSNGPSTVVVDLAGVEFIDSTGLSVLVRAQQQASERSITLGVVNPPPQATRLLSLTGLEERLTLPDPAASKHPGSADPAGPGPPPAA
jgi:anti-sigma B factor antagonist